MLIVFRNQKKTKLYIEKKNLTYLCKRRWCNLSSCNRCLLFIIVEQKEQILHPERYDCVINIL